MSREFEVTEGMRRAISTNDNWPSLLSEEADALAATLLAHPDFQRQLRAYVAEQMRGLVPAEQGHEGKPYGEAVHIRAKNEARAETLANIERWEQSHEGP